MNQFPCAICGELTGRMTETGAVCTKHFIEGWGRLPKMPLPIPKDISDDIEKDLEGLKTTLESVSPVPNTPQIAVGMATKATTSETGSLPLKRVKRPYKRRKK